MTERIFEESQDPQIIEEASAIEETEEVIRTGDSISPEDKEDLAKLDDEFEIEVDPLLEAENIVEQAQYAVLLKRDNSGKTLLKTTLYQRSLASSSQQEALRKAGVTIEKPEDLLTKDALAASTPFFQGGIQAVMDFTRISQKVQRNLTL